MAIAVHFTPRSMTGAQLDEVLRRLESAGAAAPPGRTHHIAFGTGDRLEVMDVWESPQSFEAFGATLMPILGELGIDPGQPRVEPMHEVIASPAESAAPA